MQFCKICEISYPGCELKCQLMKSAKKKNRSDKNKKAVRRRIRERKHEGYFTNISDD